MNSFQLCDYLDDTVYPRPGSKRAYIQEVCRLFLQAEVFSAKPLVHGMKDLKVGTNWNYINLGRRYKESCCHVIFDILSECQDPIG